MEVISRCVKLVNCLPTDGTKRLSGRRNNRMWLHICQQAVLVPLPSDSPREHQRNMKVLLPVNGSKALGCPVQGSIRHQGHHRPRSGGPPNRFPGLSAADARPSQPFGRGENHLRLLSWKDKHKDDILYKPI